jgi:hypothetical protein
MLTNPQGAVPMPAASTPDLKSADIKRQADDIESTRDPA